MLDAIEEDGNLDIRGYADAADLDYRTLSVLLNVLECNEVIKVENGIAKPGLDFDEYYAAKGFFYWLTQGCGELFMSLAGTVPAAKRTGEYFHRDLRAVGIASRDLGRFFFDDPFDELLKSLDFCDMADLGCGSAERLIRTAGSRPDSLGVGIDISANALQLAREAIRSAGLEDRIKLVHANAREMTYDDAFADVDLVTCFLMGHDLWPRGDCISALQRIKKAFPKVRTFVLCDTYRSEALANKPVPLFSPGFELAHAAMGVHLPTLDEWNSVFPEAGWRCAERIDIPYPPYSAMFVLTPG